MKKPQILKSEIRALLLFFVIALVFSGATAIPVQRELQLILQHLSPQSQVAVLLSDVLEAVTQTGKNFPYLFYGYDWLAFAHFVIAIAFIGPIKDPVKNVWVIEFGMIACGLIIPFALVAGGLRGLPFWWRLIDCSFGVIGIIPLWIGWLKTMELRKLYEEEKLNIIF